MLRRQFFGMTAAAIPAGNLTKKRKGPVVIESSGNELLVYSPTAAPGNLVGSIGQGGTDEYGNSWLDGQYTYAEAGGTFYAIGLASGGIQLWHATSEAGPWIADGSMADLRQEPAGQPGFAFGVPVFLAEQSSAPSTPSGGGITYVDSTGHLHYLGPGGTDTILARP